MAFEQVRLASKALGPLLRRRGTSPAVKATLRQVGKTLDKALAATDTRTQSETIRQAIDELRFGLGLIQNSQRPADHAQLEGTAEALSFLAPLEGAMAPEAVRVLVPASPQLPASALPSLQAHPNPSLPPAPTSVSRPAPAKAEHKTRSQRPLSLDFPTVRLRLDGLLRKFNALHVALTEPLTILRDLDAADVELNKIVQAVKWLGVKRIPAFLKASESADSLEDRLVASAALIHLGALGGVEKMKLTIKKREAEPQGCAYVLRSTDGTYEVRRTLSDDLSKNEGLLVLQFPGLMADKNYTLTHKLGKDGASRVLFHDRPYDKLRTRVQDLEASQPEPTETAIDGVTDELQRAHSDRLQENLADDEVSGEDMLPGFEAPE